MFILLFFFSFFLSLFSLVSSPWTCTDEKEEGVLGSLPLLSFHIGPVQPSDNINRKYAFKVSTISILTACVSVFVCLPACVCVLQALGLVTVVWVDPERV